jgi:N-acetylglucosaminyldiphosphoundecaprenol N-acetyl-beta-D-mannosaminyltransferase
MTAGIVRRAPLLVRKTGCEWLFRLAQEPRRLAGRYMYCNSRFVLTLLAEKLKRPAGRTRVEV